MDDLSKRLDHAFGLPKILNPPMRTISDQLVSMPPLSEQDITKGREVRDYPTRYDHFRTREALVEYIRYDLITKHTKWKAEWLGVSKVVSMPINITPGVYYRSSDPKHEIDCVEPARNIQHDMRRGGTLIELDPELWSLEVLQEVVNEVKQLFKPR
jgi:hypothetical protein